MATSALYTLYLSREGDSVEIKNFGNHSTIPEQAEATQCKTHEQVLAFLQKIANSEVRDSLSFYHKNNFHYDNHRGTGLKAPNHPCSLEKQISFVQYKIGEHIHGIRQAPSLLLRVLGDS